MVSQSLVDHSLSIRCCSYKAKPNARVETRHEPDGIVVHYLRFEKGQELCCILDLHLHLHLHRRMLPTVYLSRSFAVIWYRKNFKAIEAKQLKSLRTISVDVEHGKRLLEVGNLVF